jgi:tetratricopeptide (TPR) repeat protein
MRKSFVGLFAALLLITGGKSAGLAAASLCEKNDATCLTFSELAVTGQFEQIIAAAGPGRTFSAGAREHIGQAYLMMAGRESNTLEQEEQFCRKALEFGASAAYLGLYFIYAGNEPQKATGFLKQYVATNPRDPLPYVILGEYELDQRNYAAARDYLAQARLFARGRSSNLDWLMFQVHYLLGDYAAAAVMLDSAVIQGQPLPELKVLMENPRFLGIENRPEFQKYGTLISGTPAMALQ